jgi:hypothetical protein
MDEITVLQIFVEGRDYEQEQARTAPKEADRKRAAIRARLFDVLLARQVERIERMNEADLEEIADLVEKNGGFLMEVEGTDGRAMRDLVRAIERRTAEVNRFFQTAAYSKGAVLQVGTAKGWGTVGGR